MGGVTLAYGRRRFGEIECRQEFIGEIAPYLQIDRSARIPVDRSGWRLLVGLKHRLVVIACPESLIRASQIACDRQKGVTNRFGFETTQVGVGDQPIRWVVLARRGRRYARASPSLRRDDRPNQSLGRPTLAEKVAREAIQKLRMARLLPHPSKVVDGPNEPLSE